MRTILIFFHLTPIFILSNSFSILPRNELESFSSGESLNSDYGTLLFTYTIHRYPTNPNTNLSAEVIDEIIENAFSLWSSVSPFQFSRVDSNQHADVQLSFERGVHLRGHDKADLTPWDAFNVPPLHWAHAGGRLEHLVRGWEKEVHIHFNDEPRNLTNPDHLEAGGKGTWAEKMVYCEDCWYWPWQEVELLAGDLGYVAVHEMGHLLGIAHSPNKSSVMYPKLTWDTPHLEELPNEDIGSVQKAFRNYFEPLLGLKSPRRRKIKFGK